MHLPHSRSTSGTAHTSEMPRLLEVGDPRCELRDGEGEERPFLDTAGMSDGAEREMYVRVTAIEETRVLWRLALPTWATHVLAHSISQCSTFTLARMGKVELDAATLGLITMATLCVAPIIFGLGSALNTLATQAYTSVNPKTTSLYVQRTGVLMAIALVPAIAVLFHSESLLLLIKQDPLVAALAGRFIRGKLARSSWTCIAVVLLEAVNAFRS